MLLLPLLKSQVVPFSSMYSSPAWVASIAALATLGCRELLPNYEQSCRAAGLLVDSLVWSAPSAAQHPPAVARDDEPRCPAVTEACLEELCYPCERSVESEPCELVEPLPTGPLAALAKSAQGAGWASWTAMVGFWLMPTVAVALTKACCRARPPVPAQAVYLRL